MSLFNGSIYFDKPEDYPYILERLLSYHFHEVYLVKEYHQHKKRVIEETFVQHYQTINALEDTIEKYLALDVPVNKRSLRMYYERIALMEQYREEAFDLYLANYARQKKG